MIRATLAMKVKAGREGEFEQAWKAIAEQTQLAPGNLRQALLLDPQQPGLFVITSDWESREAFSRFERSDEQDQLTAPLREMRESVKMTIYQLVTAL
jgi:heme-degrading monooxygenase HmoA